ncbi:MAG: Trk system potassium transporter TrkA [Alphaproteobacteria bacterium]|nr:Trk system potassium transporter TrkA [Alphaproteobacteria bacterium]
MKVIICGAGQVGSSIAKHLADEHNDVTVIDWSAQLIDRLGTSLDVQGIVGYASHPDILERAGAANADLIIAATQSDEVNMTACQVAHSLFNLPTKIARIRTQAYIEPMWSDLFSQDHIPIDVIISPEREVADAVFRRLQVPGAFDTIPFASDRVRVMGITIDADCPVVDTPLSQLTELFPDLNARVIGITRGERTIVPTSRDQILVGDGVYLISDTEHSERALAAFGHEEPEAHRVIIIGGGNVGLFLAQSLEKRAKSMNVKIIEANPTRAEEIANLLDKTVVLHGDALDTDILREANVDIADTVVAVANDDEVNILASLLAKKEGCSRSITLINNPAYQPLMSTLGVDVYIDPRATTVSTILQHIRRGRIRGLHSLSNAGAEIIEAEALETSNIVGQRIRDLNLPGGIIFGAIVREKEVIIPRGDTEVKAHDHVVIFASAERIRKVEQLFSVQLEYF